MGIREKGQKSTRFTDRVKEGRKGLPLPATGDEKGAFALYIAMGVPTFKINDNLLILKVYLLITISRATIRPVQEMR